MGKCIRWSKWHVYDSILFSVCAFLALVPCGLSAKAVTMRQAANAAKSFWESSLTRSLSELRFLWDDSSLLGVTRTDGEALFYVFGATSGRGFVIVSGDDRIQPVLAYSFTDAAPNADDLPFAMEHWLLDITNQIRYLRYKNISLDTVTDSRGMTRAGTPVVELQTARWNQNRPYNNQCPYDGSEKSTAGCVPTATAILMRFYKWPERGNGHTEEYNTTTKDIHVSSRDLNHPYQWDLMPLEPFSDDSTDEIAQEAVSTLIADVGAAFKADYRGGDTEAIIDQSAMLEHFGYNAASHFEYRANYTDAVWLRMLKEELRARRPILYSGRGSTGGHMFIIDGYNDENFFHVNWGWGGVANGYFMLSSLSPGEYGAINVGTYNNTQVAYFGLTPSTTSVVEPDNWITFNPPGIEISSQEFDSFKRFTIDGLHFMNKTAVDFSGSLCGALTDKDGNFKSWVTPTFKHIIHNSSWSANYSNINAYIDGNIDEGDRIRFYYKSDGSQQWHLVTSANQQNCTWEVLLLPKDILQATSFTFEKTSRLITLVVKSGVQVSLISPFGNDVSGAVSKRDNTVRIDMGQLPQQEYTIRLQKGNATKDVKISIIMR